MPSFMSLPSCYDEQPRNYCLEARVVVLVLVLEEPSNRWLFRIDINRLLVVVWGAVDWEAPGRCYWDVIW